MFVRISLMVAALCFVAQPYQRIIGQEVSLVTLANPLTAANKIRPMQSSGPGSLQAEGTLLLCGGGTIPKVVRDRFYLSGKGAQGTLVVIPTASEQSDRGDFARFIDYWSEFRWHNLAILHMDNREASFRDDSALRLLEQATAVWIAGGDQSRLAERYAGTPIESGLKALIHRGGIVGGTSAGAAIASDSMISGGYCEPTMSRGFTMLTKAIVDQHFSQKGRSMRLRTAICRSPERTGIGIDESTGLFISPQKSKVVGEGSVFVYKMNGTSSNAPIESPSQHFLDFESVMDTTQLLNGDEIATLDLDVFAN